MGFKDTLDDAVKTLAPLMGDKAFTVDTLISEDILQYFEMNPVPKDRKVCDTFLEAGACVSEHLSAKYQTPLYEACVNAPDENPVIHFLYATYTYYADYIVHDTHCSIALPQPPLENLNKTLQAASAVTVEGMDPQSYHALMGEHMQTAANFGYVLHKRFGKERFKEYAHSAPNQAFAMLKEAIELEFGTN